MLVATFLAPNMMPVHSYIAERIGRRLGLSVSFRVGSCYSQLADGFEAAFLCGLALVELNRTGKADLEPIAAPVLHGDRFGGRPIYFSDVVVRRDSGIRCFDDLRGRSWCYNEPFSQSGYGITRHRLVNMGETSGFFGRVVEAGWHERSIQLVASGEIDASAIDCQVLEIARRDQPDLLSQLRIIDVLGPSTIQPFVAARRLPSSLKADILAAILELNDDPEARRRWRLGCIERFVPVVDADYDDLRAMRAACADAGFMTLR